MNADTQISLSLIFSVLASLGVIVAIVQAFKKDNDTRTKEKLDIEKNFVKINLKLDTFCDDVKEILKNQEKSNDELRQLSERAIKDHERIEDHERRLTKLEENQS
jgi:hypothetical protein